MMQRGDNPWLTRTVAIRRIRDEVPGVKTYDLEFSGPDQGRDYRFLPGQFNMLYLPGVGEAAISISGDAEQPGPLKHTIRAVGNVTREIETLGVGSTLGLRGPFGKPWPTERLGGLESETERPDVVLVAGGVGLAPLRSVILFLKRYREQIGRADLLIGARTPDNLLFRDDYTSWSAARINVLTTVDRAAEQWSGNVGVVTLLLDRLVLPRPESTVLLTCGPEVMMRYVIRSALGRGFQPRNLYVSLERQMNCAIGLCGHCQLGPEFVCKDGPVFRYDQIGPWLQIRDL